MNDIKISTFIAEIKVIDNGSLNKNKEKLENYYDYYTQSLLQICTDIRFIQLLMEKGDELQILFDYAPSFMTNAYLNTWYSAIVMTSRIFSDKDTRLEKFLNFVEQNEKQIFTSKHYVAMIPEGQIITEDKKVWEEKTREKLADVLAAARLELVQVADDVNLLKSVRDKVFAHLDKKMLIVEKREALLAEMNVGLIEKITKVAGNVVNKIYYYDKFSSIAFEPIDRDDVLKIANACSQYDKHKIEIIKKDIAEIRKR